MSGILKFIVQKRFHRKVTQYRVGVGCNLKKIIFSIFLVFFCINPIVRVCYAGSKNIICIYPGYIVGVACRDRECSSERLEMALYGKSPSEHSDAPVAVEFRTNGYLPDCTNSLSHVT